MRIGRSSLAWSLIAAAAIGVPGCGYPAYEFGEGDAAGDAPLEVGPGDAPPDLESIDAEPCPIVVGGDACNSIARFSATQQIVDGRGDEFCGIAATKTYATNAAWRFPNPPPPGIDTVFYTRVAWSSDALHVHVRVEQAQVSVPSSTEELWHGDTFELFASGFDALGGSFANADDPGAIQVLAAPPSAAVGARANVYRNRMLQTFLSPANFAARLVPGGYEIELKLEWATLHGSPVSGARIGFDAGIDVRQDASIVGPKFQAFLGFRAQSGAGPCGADGQAHPSCDDRTWCVPKLE